MSDINITANEVSGVRKAPPTRAVLPPRLAALLTGRRALYAGLGLAALLWLLGRGMFGSDEAQSIPTTDVKRGHVRITITESGELRAENQATITAPTDKQIIWLAPEGTWVKEGDALVKFESQKYVIQRDSAQSALEVAQAELQAALSDLDGQRNAERKSYLDYQALPELAKKGFINQSEVEAARLSYEEVKSQTRTREAAVSAKRANVNRAEKDMDDRQRKLDTGVVSAPRAGLVVYAEVGGAGSGRKITVGMTPFEGMDLMFVPDISSMVVDAEISEFDLSKVKIGNPAELRLDAYPDAVFRGEVARVSALARRKISKVTEKPTGLKVFDVTIKVLDQDDRLKPGLTSTVDILVSDHEDVLYVPVAGVFLDDLDETVVYVEGADGVEARPVTIEQSSERIAIVSSGVSEGEKVLLSVPQSL